MINAAALRDYNPDAGHEAASHKDFAVCTMYSRFISSTDLHLAARQHTLQNIVTLQGFHDPLHEGHAVLQRRSSAGLQCRIVAVAAALARSEISRYGAHTAQGDGRLQVGPSAAAAAHSQGLVNAVLVARACDIGALLTLVHGNSVTTRQLVHHSTPSLSWAGR